MNKTRLGGALASAAVIAMILASSFPVGTVEGAQNLAAAPSYTVTVATNSTSYAASSPGSISGSVSPAPPANSVVALEIDSPTNQSVFTQTASVSSSGTFTGSFVPSPEWGVAGTYRLTATYTSYQNATCTNFYVAALPFSYVPYVSTTTTTTASGPAPTSTSSSSTCPPETKVVTPVSTSSTSSSTKTTTATSTTPTTVTVTAPPSTTTITSPPTTVTSASTVTTTLPPGTTTTTLTTTSTATSIATSTTTSTTTSMTTSVSTTSSVPAWAYGAMVLLLVVGLAIGFLVKGPISRRPASSAPPPQGASTQAGPSAK